MYSAIKAIALASHRRGRADKMHGDDLAFAQSQCGIAATEFALIAPVLIFALIASLDIGRLVTEKMRMDAMLRGAAQSVMMTGQENRSEAVLSGVAALSKPTFGADTEESDVRVFCACPNAVATQVPCDQQCTGGPTSVFAVLSVSKQSENLLLPEVALSAETLVQLR